jgi:hypothetical protein
MTSVEKTLDQIASDKTATAYYCYAHPEAPDSILDPEHINGKGPMMVVSTDIANIYSFI